STPQLSHGENDSNGPNTVLFIVEDRGWTITSVSFWKQQADNNCYFRIATYGGLGYPSSGMVEILVTKMKAFEAKRLTDRQTGHQVPYPGFNWPFFWRSI